MWVGGQSHAPAASAPGKDPVPIVQEAGWASGSVWTGGKSRPHRDSIPDRPARNQSLYRLSYRVYRYELKVYNFVYNFDLFIYIKYWDFTQFSLISYAFQCKAEHCVCTGITSH